MIFFSIQGVDLSNEALWRMDRCTREEAERLLANKPDGTFLVRMAKNGKFALSIS